MRQSILLNDDPTVHAELTAVHEACKVLQVLSLEGCVVMPVVNRARCVRLQCVWSVLIELFMHIQIRIQHLLVYRLKRSLMFCAQSYISKKAERLFS